MGWIFLLCPSPVFLVCNNQGESCIGKTRGSSPDHPFPFYLYPYVCISFFFSITFFSLRFDTCYSRITSSMGRIEFKRERIRVEWINVYWMRCIRFGNNRSSAQLKCFFFLRPLALWVSFILRVVTGENRAIFYFYFLCHLILFAHTNWVNWFLYWGSKWTNEKNQFLLYPINSS